MCLGWREFFLRHQEARIQAAQLRGHRQLYEVKGPHRLLLVGEGGGELEQGRKVRAPGWLGYIGDDIPYLANG